MQHDRPSDEDLMAYADDALPPEAKAAVAAALVRDPKLRQRVEMYRSTRTLIGQSLKPLATEPVPDTLEQSVRAMIGRDNSSSSEKVVPFRQKPATVARPQNWSLPLAASIAALAAGIAGYGLGWSNSGSPPGSIATVGERLPLELVGLLDTTLAGGEAMVEGDRVRLIASVNTQDGLLCREFEVDDLQSKQTTAGIACRIDGNWQLNIAVAAPAADGGFAPASSLSALDGYLSAIGADEPLPPDQEKAALKARN